MTLAPTTSAPPTHGDRPALRPALRPARVLPLLVLAAAGAAATLAIAAAPGAAGEADAKRGRAALEQSAAAYVAAPALVDVARLEIKMDDQPTQKVEIEYGFGPKSDAYVRLPGLSATALDGRLYVTRDDVVDKYLDVALQGDLASTMDAILGAESNLPVQFDMRAGRGVDEFLAALSLGAIQEPRITGHGKTVLENGAKADRISIAGGNGEAQVWIDAESRLVRRIEFAARTPAPNPSNLAATIDYDPKTSISPGGVVAFAPADRKSVARYDALHPERIVIGSMAPDFELESLDGEIVRLSDLRGRVVVLDFWATWCGPCRMGLPLIHQFDTWVRENDQPVTVLAIDTFERAESIDAMRKAAASYWNKQAFSMPTLLDADNRTAYQYGVSGIPLTIVVDQSGRVSKMHQGYDPGIVETLKRNAQALVR